MKFLILSTATGEGHNSAAKALKESLEKRGCEASVTDPLKLGRRDASLPVSRMYAHITVYHPFFFGLLYHIGETVSSSRHHSPIFYLNAIYADSLYKKIQTQKPDAIVCTHVFCAQAITRIREKYLCEASAVGVMTDYACIPFWEETRLDSYIIPSRKLENEFIKKGIPAEKLEPLGIPAGERFCRKGSKEAARQELGFSAKHIFLIMSGSMGYGKIQKLAAALVKLVPDAQAVVLCGENKKLYSGLCGLNNIRPYEYTENVDIFMDAADVLLTKPGGLSSSEALAKGIPLVFTCPIPGCEEKNAAFISSLGAAACARNVSEAAEFAKRLAEDTDAARRMVEAQREYFLHNVSSSIAEYLIRFAETGENIRQSQ